MPVKLDRCVKQVKARNPFLPKSKRVNPFAVCQAAMNKKRQK